MTIREFAIYFAGAAHKDQMYGESLYVHHLAAVDQVLDDIGIPEIRFARISAWLHDTVEDCGVKIEDISKRFGDTVGYTVWCVTNEKGKNRKERSEKTYPKIASNENSLLVKLADRIANIEHSLNINSKFGLMYVKEHPDFVGALRTYWTGSERVQLLWNRYDEAVARTKSYYGI